MTVLSQSCDPKDFRTVLGTEDNTGTARASLLQFSSQKCLRQERETSGFGISGSEVKSQLCY